MKRFRVKVEQVHSYTIDVEAETDMKAQQIAKHSASLRRPDSTKWSVEYCSPMPELPQPRDEHPADFCRRVGITLD